MATRENTSIGFRPSLRFACSPEAGQAAYSLGRDAVRKNWPRVANPYDQGDGLSTNEWSLWRLGWEEAMRGIRPRDVLKLWELKDYTSRGILAPTATDSAA